jgi:carboxylesterase
VRYDRWASNAIHQIYELTNETRARLENVSQPLLLIYARRDQTVALRNMEIVTEGVSSAHIEQHVLEESGHILPQDIEREKVFALTADFVKRISQNEPVLPD